MSREDLLDVPDNVIKEAERMRNEIEDMFPTGWEDKEFCVEVTQYIHETCGGKIAYGYYYDDKGRKQVHVWNVVDGWEYDMNPKQHHDYDYNFWVGTEKDHPFAKKVGELDSLKVDDDWKSDEYIDVWRLI